MSWRDGDLLFMSPAIFGGIWAEGPAFLVVVP